MDGQASSRRAATGPEIVLLFIFVLPVARFLHSLGFYSSKVETRANGGL
jgi:hypothetical protein